eukprot:1182532-Rhodomonas_salina.2
MLMLPRALYLALGGSVGPFWSVLWSVRRRRRSRWVTGKQRALRKRFEEEREKRQLAAALAAATDGPSRIPRQLEGRPRSCSASPMPGARRRGGGPWA